MSRITDSQKRVSNLEVNQRGVINVDSPLWIEVYQGWRDLKNFIDEWKKQQHLYETICRFSVIVNGKTYRIRNPRDAYEIAYCHNGEVAYISKISGTRVQRYVNQDRTKDGLWTGDDVLDEEKLI